MSKFKTFSRKLSVLSSVCLLSYSTAGCSISGTDNDADDANNTLTSIEAVPLQTTYHEFEAAEDYTLSALLSDKIIVVNHLEENDTTTDCLISRSITKDSLGDAVTIWSGNESEEILNFDLDLNGNIYIALQDDQENKLVKLSADAQVLYETSFHLEETEPSHYSSAYPLLAVDKNECVYLFSNDSILYLYDQEGQCTGQVNITDDNYIDYLVKDTAQNIYAITTNKASEKNNGALTKIEYASHSLGEASGNFPIPSSASNVCAEGNGTFLIALDDALYSYSASDETVTVVTSWKSNDLTGDIIRGIGLLPDDTIYTVMQAHTEQDVSLAFLDRSTPVTTTSSEKQNIVLACLDDSSISSLIAEFNRNNPSYHVEVKSYWDPYMSDNDYLDAITKLNNDIISGKGPDIIDLDTLQNLEAYANKGIFEDLTPYLEKSSILSKDDFFPQLLKNATYNNALIYIPNSFYVRTWLAKSSLVGNTPGWNLDQVLSTMQANPNAHILDEMLPEFLISDYVALNRDQLIDSSVGKCHFDSDGFRSFLTFLKEGADYEDQHGTDQRLDYYRFKDNTLIASQAMICGFNDIPNKLDLFGDSDSTYIGIPETNGSNGCLMIPSGGYAISSTSSNKEGAWAFLEFYLSKDLSEDFNTSDFYARKSLFEKQKQIAIKGDYNQSQKELLSFTHSDTSGNSWTYHYRPITQKEADEFEQLLNNASVSSVNDDYDLMTILYDEITPYLSGDRGIDEAISVIQNRCSLYLSENH